MEKIIFLIFVAFTAIDSKYKQNIWIHDKHFVQFCLAEDNERIPFKLSIFQLYNEMSFKIGQCFGETN